MRWASGEAVSRHELRDILRQAAVAHGMPADTVVTQYLRIAGASALFRCSGGNAALTKRLGRWSSEAYEGYVWEDRQLAAGISGRILAAPWSVHPGMWGELAV